VRNKAEFMSAVPIMRVIDVLGGLNLADEFSLVAVDGLLGGSRAWSRLAR
jgi:hypothetical protein